MNSCINETTTQPNGWGHISVWKLNKVGIALPSQHTDKLHYNKNFLVMSLYFGNFCVSLSSQLLAIIVHIASLPYHVLRPRRFCIIYVNKTMAWL
jgi:hypothetical protein